MLNITTGLLSSILFIILNIIECKIKKKDVVLKDIIKNAILTFLSVLVVEYVMVNYFGNDKIVTEAFVNNPDF